MSRSELQGVEGPFERKQTVSRACVTLFRNCSQNDSPSITCCLEQKRQFVTRMWVLRADRYCFRKLDCSSRGRVKLFSSSRIFCEMKLCIHPARIGSGWPPREAEIGSFVWWQPTQTLDGPSWGSRNSPRHSTTLSRQRLRYRARSRSAQPSNKPTSSPIDSNVMELSRVRRAVLSISGLSRLLHAIAYAWNDPFPVSVEYDLHLTSARIDDWVEAISYFCEAARRSKTLS